MRAPVVHPLGLNQRFEFRSMDAGADVLQNAARFLDACSVRTRPPTSPPLGLHPWRRPLLHLPFKGDQTGQSEDTSAAACHAIAHRTPLTLSEGGSAKADALPLLD